MPRNKHKRSRRVKKEVTLHNAATTSSRSLTADCHQTQSASSRAQGYEHSGQSVSRISDIDTTTYLDLPGYDTNFKERIDDISVGDSQDNVDGRTQQRNPDGNDNKRDTTGLTNHPCDQSEQMVSLEERSSLDKALSSPASVCPKFTSSKHLTVVSTFLTLDRFSKKYIAGENVTGRVEIVVNKKLPCSRLSICYRGMCFVKTYLYQKYDPDDILDDNVDENFRLQSKCLQLWPSNFEYREHIDVGHYTFPFDLQLPENSSTSFGEDDDRLTIKYNLYLDILSPSDTSPKILANLTSFHVLPIQSMNILLQKPVVIETELSFPDGSSCITFEVEINKPAILCMNGSFSVIIKAREMLNKIGMHMKIFPVLVQRISFPYRSIILQRVIVDFYKDVRYELLSTQRGYTMTFDFRVPKILPSSIDLEEESTDLRVLYLLLIHVWREDADTPTLVLKRQIDVIGPFKANDLLTLCHGDPCKFDVEDDVETNVTGEADSTGIERNVYFDLLNSNVADTSFKEDKDCDHPVEQNKSESQYLSACTNSKNLAQQPIKEAPENECQSTSVKISKERGNEKGSGEENESQERCSKTHEFTSLTAPIWVDTFEGSTDGPSPETSSFFFKKGQSETMVTMELPERNETTRENLTFLFANENDDCSPKQKEFPSNSSEIKMDRALDFELDKIADAVSRTTLKEMSQSLLHKGISKYMKTGQEKGEEIKCRPKFESRNVHQHVDINITSILDNEATQKKENKVYIDVPQKTLRSSIEKIPISLSETQDTLICSLSNSVNEIKILEEKDQHEDPYKRIHQKIQSDNFKTEKPLVGERCSLGDTKTLYEENHIVESNSQLNIHNEISQKTSISDIGVTETKSDIGHKGNQAAQSQTCRTEKARKRSSCRFYLGGRITGGTESKKIACGKRSTEPLSHDTHRECSLTACQTGHHKQSVKVENIEDIPTLNYQFQMLPDVKADSIQITSGEQAEHFSQTKQLTSSIDESASHNKPSGRSVNKTAVTDYECSEENSKERKAQNEVGFSSRRSKNVNKESTILCNAIEAAKYDQIDCFPPVTSVSDIEQIEMIDNKTETKDKRQVVQDNSKCDSEDSKTSFENKRIGDDTEKHNNQSKESEVNFSTNQNFQEAKVQNDQVKCLPSSNEEDFREVFVTDIKGTEISDASGPSSFKATTHSDAQSIILKHTARDGSEPLVHQSTIIDAGAIMTNRDQPGKMVSEHTLLTLETTECNFKDTKACEDGTERPISQHELPEGVNLMRCQTEIVQEGNILVYKDHPVTKTGQQVETIRDDLLNKEYKDTLVSGFKCVRLDETGIDIEQAGTISLKYQNTLLKNPQERLSSLEVQNRKDDSATSVKITLQGSNIKIENELETNKILSPEVKTKKPRSKISDRFCKPESLRRRRSSSGSDKDPSNNSKSSENQHCTALKSTNITVGSASCSSESDHQNTSNTSDGKKVSQQTVSMESNGSELHSSSKFTLISDDLYIEGENNPLTGKMINKCEEIFDFEQLCEHENESIFDPIDGQSSKTVRQSLMKYNDENSLEIKRIIDDIQQCPSKNQTGSSNNKRLVTELPNMSKDLFVDHNLKGNNTFECNAVTYSDMGDIESVQKDENRQELPTECNMLALQAQEKPMSLTVVHNMPKNCLTHSDDNFETLDGITRSTHFEPANNESSLSSQKLFGGLSEEIKCTLKDSDIKSKNDFQNNQCNFTENEETSKGSVKCKCKNNNKYFNLSPLEPKSMILEKSPLKPNPTNYSQMTQDDRLRIKELFEGSTNIGNVTSSNTVGDNQAVPLMEETHFVDETINQNNKVGQKEKCWHIKQLFEDWTFDGQPNLGAFPKFDLWSYQHSEDRKKALTIEDLQTCILHSIDCGMDIGLFNSNDAVLHFKAQEIYNAYTYIMLPNSMSPPFSQIHINNTSRHVSYSKSFTNKEKYERKLLFEGATYDGKYQPNNFKVMSDNHANSYQNDRETGSPKREIVRGLSHLIQLNQHDDDSSENIQYSEMSQIKTNQDINKRQVPSKQQSNAVLFSQRHKSQTSSNVNKMFRRKLDNSLNSQKSLASHDGGKAQSIQKCYSSYRRRSEKKSQENSDDRKKQTMDVLNGDSIENNKFQVTKDLLINSKTAKEDKSSFGQRGNRDSPSEERNMPRKTRELKSRVIIDVEEYESLQEKKKTYTNKINENLEKLIDNWQEDTYEILKMLRDEVVDIDKKLDKMNTNSRTKPTAAIYIPPHQRSSSLLNSHTKVPGLINRNSINLHHNSCPIQPKPNLKGSIYFQKRLDNNSDIEQTECYTKANIHHFRSNSSLKSHASNSCNATIQSSTFKTRNLLKQPPQRGSR